MKLVISTFIILGAINSFASEKSKVRNPAKDISSQVLFTANDSAIVGTNPKVCSVGVLQIFRDNDRLYVISSNRLQQVQRIDLTKDEQQQLAEFGNSGSSISITRDGRTISLKVDDTDKVPGISAFIRENDGGKRELYQGPNGAFYLGCNLN